LQPNALEIQLKDSVFDPALPPTDPNNRVLVSHKGDDTYYYRVFLFIDGYDLPYVEKVTYALDDSFSEPVQTVRRTPATQNCQLPIWTWKTRLTVTATIVDKKGNSYRISHDLVYASELPQDSNLYEYVKEEPTVARPTLVSA
jgi:prokaryotic YEATS domain